MCDVLSFACSVEEALIILFGLSNSGRQFLIANYKLLFRLLDDRRYLPEIAYGYRPGSEKVDINQARVKHHRIPERITFYASKYEELLQIPENVTID